MRADGKKERNKSELDGSSERMVHAATPMETGERPEHTSLHCKSATAPTAFVQGVFGLVDEFVPRSDCSEYVLSLYLVSCPHIWLKMEAIYPGRDDPTLENISFRCCIISFGKIR